MVMLLTTTMQYNTTILVYCSSFFVCTVQYRYVLEQTLERDSFFRILKISLSFHFLFSIAVKRDTTTTTNRTTVLYWY